MDVTEEQEWKAVRAALRDAGVDPTDLARFINTPHPGIPGLEPSEFDSLRAYPVLMEWLPRVEAPNVVDTLASRIRESGTRSESAQALLVKYRERSSWQLGDAIAAHDDALGTRRCRSALPRRAHGCGQTDARLRLMAYQDGRSESLDLAASA
jgi:hypothetical protein